MGSAPAAAMEPEVRPGNFIGRYQVLAKLATGGMADIFFARGRGVLALDHLLAVKVIHAELARDETLLQMFVDEATLALGLRHRNIVRTHDVGSSDYGHYLVMEYVAGDSLYGLRRVARERLPLPPVLRILQGALRGLVAAHESRDARGTPLGIVHLDVSPQNILVGADGITRLVDFGVAKARGQGVSAELGHMMGKFSYMAPEQIRGASVDPRTDVFSAGVVLWEMLTGQRLFTDETPEATLANVLTSEIPRPSRVTGDSRLGPFDRLIERALAQEPKDRHESARSLLEALERAADEVGGVGSMLDVQKLVQRYAAEKLERERAIADAGLRQVESLSPEVTFVAPRAARRLAQRTSATPPPRSRTPVSNVPKPRAAKPKAKGTALWGGVRILRSMKDRARELLDPSLHHYLEERVYPAGWYPEEDLLALIRACVKLNPLPEAQALDIIGVWMANEHLDKFYGPRGGHQSFPMRMRGANFWRALHDSGEYSATVTSPCGATAELIGFRHPSRELCAIITSYAGEILRRTGFEDVEVAKLQCVLEGHEWCAWEYRWSNPLEP